MAIQRRPGSRHTHDLGKLRCGESRKPIYRGGKWEPCPSLPRAGESELNSSSFIRLLEQAKLVATVKGVAGGRAGRLRRKYRGLFWWEFRRLARDVIFTIPLRYAGHGWLQWA